MKIILVVLCYLQVTSFVHVVMATGNNTTYAEALWEELYITRGYNPNIRPVFNEYDVTDVSLSLYLKSINNFDEVAGIFKVTAYMYIEWIDEFLTWNSSDYDGINLIRWSQDDVWKPDVTLYNSANNYIALGHKTILIENDENGSMSWAPMEVFESSCSVDMTYYPYDIQTCELQFMSWSYADDTVTLSMADDTVQLEDYSTNAQWDILSTNVSYVNETAGAYVDLISFKIKLQRKPRHHLITLFLPIILLAVSEIFVFALPSDGGEKSGYAVTVFLAFAVFLTIVNTAMPANSEKVSIFSVYLVIQTAQSTLITILSLLSIRCASLDETTRIPSGFVALVRLSQCGCKETNAPKSNRIGNMDEVSEVEKNGSSCSLDDKEETETCSWKMVTNAVDKICFMVFSAVFVITTTVCFCVIFLAPD